MAGKLSYIQVEKSMEYKKEGDFSATFSNVFSENYLFSFLASAFFVTSYMIGVAMKIEA